MAIAVAGDRSAFAQLFGAFAPKIKGYMLRLGVDEPRAEELAQETLLAIWRKAGQFDPGRASAAAWIFTIARNLRVDMLRRDHNPAQMWGDDMRQEPLNPEQVLGGSQDDQSLWHAIGRLPPECTEVVRLSFVEDRSHAEIAQSLSLPLGTVKSRLRRAFERLRLVLVD